MYLKRLEITGFKSFADRVKLDFEPGITAVVGPNGCGKSNIIDAIRWCLGEMSAKSLRSSLMMDVVFNGSGSRPPQNLSEVTLTFDNTDKRLPIDFSEVSISRRLFRSGESEYFINKAQCRLRDIRELFLDTGMGEDGYSSIEQGKVEWVLQAKPEERRELFEEAAGISKYRAHREEALRKLDRVDLDLSRLADIISVTNDQIRKLENSVNRAKTYRRIREELKTLEVSDWLSQLNNLDLDIQTTENNLNALQKTVEELNTQTHNQEAVLSELQLKMTEKEEELLEANSVLAAIEADIKIGEERQANFTQRENELTSQLENIHINIKREDEQITELTEQESKQKIDLEKVKEEGAGIETEYAEAQKLTDESLHNLEMKKASVKEGRDLILKKTDERHSNQEKLQSLTSEVTRLESQSENLQKDLGKLTALIGEILEHKDNSFKLNEELKEQNYLKSTELEFTTKEIIFLKKQENKNREEILSTTEDIAKLAGQIQSLKDKQSRDPYLKGTQAVLAENFNGIYGPIGKIFRCNQDNKDIVSATIGDHLGDLVADTLEDAQKVVQFLSEKGAGRARIWILDRLTGLTPHHPIGSAPAGERLISRIQCDDRFRPLLVHLCSTHWVEGSTIYGHAIINGGSHLSQWNGHIALRLPELEKELAQKEVGKKGLENILNRTLEKHTSVAAKREKQFKELEEVRVRLQMAEEETQNVDKKVLAAKSEKEHCENEIKILRDDKDKASHLFEEFQKKIQELQHQENVDHANLDKLQQELTEVQQAQATASADLAAKSEGHNAFQEKLDWQNSILEHSQNEIKAVQANRTRHQDSIDQIKLEIENAKKSQEEARGLVETSLKKREGSSNTCTQIQETRVDISEKIQAQRKEISEFRKNLTENQERHQNERLALANLKNKNENIDQKLNEQYELNRDQAKALFTPQPAEPEVTEKLKKRISNMGSINMAAPEEHAELSEKNNFLISQEQDLLKAKNDLKQVITKINATTREHFRETFGQIQQNFRKLYSQLFQGGEADIKLTNEADILTSGIDIFCQPPGKKLLHISLLSGGEKALTAVALLFAFFQVRPSPVALLDEVDAPLDDANVVRFVDMVKTFSEKSQFLIITHSKKTMEQANTIYGVTMEEYGVSKILSARLMQKKKIKIEPPVETEAAPV